MTEAITTASQNIVEAVFVALFLVDRGIHTFLRCDTLDAAIERAEEMASDYRHARRRHQLKSDSGEGQAFVYDESTKTLHILWIESCRYQEYAGATCRTETSSNWETRPNTTPEQYLEEQAKADAEQAAEWAKQASLDASAKKAKIRAECLSLGITAEEYRDSIDMNAHEDAEREQYDPQYGMEHDVDE